MDSHGGWIASGTQLVQFLNHVAGAPGIPALLKPATIKLMTTPRPGLPTRRRPLRPRLDGPHTGAGNRWHNGSLPGTTTIMNRTSTGFCWAGPCNTRSQPSNEIDAGPRPTPMEHGPQPSQAGEPDNHDRTDHMGLSPTMNFISELDDLHVIRSRASAGLLVCLGRGY